MKLPKLNKATSTCGLRPCMMNIFITKEDVVAADGHILVAHKTNDFFSKEFIERIPNEGMYISGEDWKVLTVKFTAITLDKSGIVSVFNKNGERLIRTKSVDRVGKFPDWKELFNQFKNKDNVCGEFGIRPKLLFNLSEAVGSFDLKLKCYDNSSAIQVLPGSPCDYRGVVALIMPVMINN